MSTLFTPLPLRSLTIPNRIVVSPMCQYSAVEGHAQPWHTVHLGRLALSGAGLVLIEATGVEAAGRISLGCLGLYDDATEEALAGVLRTVRSVGGAPIGIQLGHAGRKASTARPWEGGAQIAADAGGWTPVAPSAVPMNDGEATPHALGRDELHALGARFVDAVLRADRLGLDAVEVHAAHGYLLHQFLSPIANRREDEYGGSRENRMRWPLAVIAAMRAAWPAHKPLGVRLSATDWLTHLPAAERFDLPDAIEFARRCAALGVDWIDASSGGLSPQQKLQAGPGFQVPFAEAIRRETKLPVIAVGLITEPQQAEEIVASGKADMVALARGLLYDPHWPWHAAAALGASIEPPRQYLRAQPREHPQLFAPGASGRR
ncbi:MAG: oxidoreductase [Burkholderiales bacterium]|jgi:2,4-dienoyl-CoA reductase-like NADH-dependent reductase (Old Yellow Enzyme family)|nr:NADH:flavin oxidoreductase/NADH oxidase [Burkholderiaceae bacterium]